MHKACNRSVKACESSSILERGANFKHVTKLLISTFFIMLLSFRENFRKVGEDSFLWESGEVGGSQQSVTEADCNQKSQTNKITIMEKHYGK